MLSETQLAIYRQMSAGEKLRLTLQMIEENVPYLLKGSAEVVERRFELIHRENDLRNQNMLAALARTRDSESVNEERT